MSEQDITNATPYGFIPSPLLLEDRPELAVFSLNVMFMSQANINGVDTSGTALYEPFFASYRKNGHTQSMRYYNIYSEEDYIDMTYSSDKWKYIGVKYIKGKEVLSAYGADWRMFFVHLTMNGLAKCESCIFKPLQP